MPEPQSQMKAAWAKFGSLRLPLMLPTGVQENLLSETDKPAACLYEGPILPKVETVLSMHSCLLISARHPSCQLFSARRLGR